MTKSNKSTVCEAQEVANGFYSVYEDYARTLRTWLVAYGIGGPALMLTNDKVREEISKSEGARHIVLCYLVGAGLQVVLAALNKTAMWILYDAENSGRKDGWWRARAKCFSSCYCIDFLVDTASIVMFSYSTYRVLDILLLNR